MKTILLLCVLIPMAAVAQPVLSLTGPASVAPGGTATLTLSINGSTGASITALQWANPAGVTIGTPAIAPGVAATGKALYCGSNGCVIVGLAAGKVSNAAITDGALASIPITLPASSPLGPMTLHLTGLNAANITGNSVAATEGTVYSIRVISKCDVTGDGAVDASDMTPIISAITSGASCPLSGGCTLQSLIAVLLAALGGPCTL
jgi:hypothetical protein